MMTSAYILGRIDEIKQHRQNPEKAEKLRQRLYIDVLREIARGNIVSQALAMAVVKADDLTFEAPKPKESSPKEQIKHTVDYIHNTYGEEEGAHV
jgi:hypothetical protein